VLHEAVSTPKGDKRGAAFGRARLNLSKYASATVGKRVVLTLAAEGPACAGGDKARAITAVVTVAAEPSDKTPTGSSNALDEVGASAAKADLDGASQPARCASARGCACTICCTISTLRSGVPCLTRVTSAARQTTAMTTTARMRAPRARWRCPCSTAAAARRMKTVRR
jgi:hypothetical protein